MKTKFCKLLAATFVLSFGLQANAQIITRFAGNDTLATGGFGGDGGPATAAGVKMNQPVALAIDLAGNVFIAEGNGSRVRMVSATGGIISTVCGTGTIAFFGDYGPATAAKLSTPRGLAIDPAGNLVIADGNNNRIRRIDHSTGIITTIAGTGAAGFAGDNGPATAADFFIPHDVKYDAAGNLYVCDCFNNAIRKISTSGIITTIAGNGTPGCSGDNGPATAASLHFPRRSAFDAAGNLYVVDGNNNSIRRINSTTGIITTVAGSPTGAYGTSGDGGPATVALLSGPTSVKFDAAGNMYIADYGNQRIRKVSAATGIMNTIVGNGLPYETGDGGPATAATIDKPFDIEFDASGNLYIADYGGQTVRKVSPVPTLGTHQYRVANNEIVLSPNPNNGTFTVRGYLRTLSEENVLLTVTNTLGQVVYSGEARAHLGFVEEQISIRDGLTGGLYLLQMRSGTETTIIRFMKNNE